MKMKIVWTVKRSRLFLMMKVGKVVVLLEVSVGSQKTTAWMIVKAPHFLLAPDRTKRVVPDSQ